MGSNLSDLACKHPSDRPVQKPSPCTTPTSSAPEQRPSPSPFDPDCSVYACPELSLTTLGDGAIGVYLAMGFQSNAAKPQVHVGVVLESARSQRFRSSQRAGDWSHALVHLTAPATSGKRKDVPVHDGSGCILVDVANCINDFRELIVSPVNGNLFESTLVGSIAASQVADKLNCVVQVEKSRRFMVAISDTDVLTATNCMAFAVRILNALELHFSSSDIISHAERHVNPVQAAQLGKQWGHYWDRICNVGMRSSVGVVPDGKHALVAIGHSCLASDKTYADIPDGAKLLTYPPPGESMLVDDAFTALVWMHQHKAVATSVGPHFVRENTQMSPGFTLSGDDKFHWVGLWKVVPGQAVTQLQDWPDSKSNVNVQTLFGKMSRYGCDYLVLMGCKDDPALDRAVRPCLHPCNRDAEATDQTLTSKDRIVPPSLASEYKDLGAVELKDTDGTTAADLVMILYQVLPNGAARAAKMKPHFSNKPYIVFVPIADVPDLYAVYQDPEFKHARARNRAQSSRRPHLIFPPFPVNSVVSHLL